MCGSTNCLGAAESRHAWTKRKWRKDVDEIGEQRRQQLRFQYLLDGNADATVEGGLHPVETERGVKWAYVE